MEQMTKRILAIVLIAVIGTGIGVGAWFFLATPAAAANPYEYPGLGDQKMPLDHTIKIGVLDDMSQTGVYSWRGAWMAARDINLAGGIDINGTTYFVGIVKEDTKEAAYDNEAAVAAAIKMVGYKPDACLGGFRSETFEIYISRIMEADIPFMITGTASPKFCQEWLGNPLTRDFYKWLFRCMPINSDHLGEQTGYLLKEYIVPNITEHQGFHVDNAWIVYEDLIWTEDIKNGIMDILNSSFPNYLGPANITVQKIPKRTGPTAWTPTEFGGLWANMDADGAQLIIPIISDIYYGFYFGSFYNVTKPNALVCGINVAAQTGYYWPSTGGKSAYEVTIHGISYVNQTVRTIPWYDNFTATWGFEPIYCGIGGTDAVNLFCTAIENEQSLRNTDIVAGLETFDQGNPFPGIGANVAFDANHDVLETIPGVRDGFFSAPFRQYHPDGSLPLIPAGDLYPWKHYVPASSKSYLIYPPWW
jgi:hypothetical protein